METDFQQRVFDYQPRKDSSEGRRPVVVVGAGPVGLATAIDLARQGVPVILLDDDNRLSTGSRAICFAKRTLEVFDRLGCGDPMVGKGVSWNVGRVFMGDQPLYSFDLLPEQGHERPAFINLQQYYVEGYLHERARELALLELRWSSKVTGLVQDTEGVTLTVSAPDGEYALQAEYVVAADGGKSAIRNFLGLESKGRIFRDRFLIADVKMTAEFPSERWFWFDPPFHRGQSVLLHRQPDDVWRIDFQLGWDADPVAEREPGRVMPRIRALLGKEVDFTLEWVSIYTFCCLRMDKFRHGRVLFAGDSAHGVSPFGARGANSGVQDADNLAWKLRLVLQGKAPAALLDTYASEREYAADENILNSTRATDFITPKSAVSRLFRDATLQLARDHAFARKLVNSGRLSMPSVYGDSPLNTADAQAFGPALRPGSPAADAPVEWEGKADWLLRHVGDDFTGIYFAGSHVDDSVLRRCTALADGPIPVRTLVIAAPGTASGPGVLVDRDGLVRQRYGALPGSYYLLRPDQHVCARWREFDEAAVRQAVARATCNLEQAA
ncbi:FAD-dependent oxidoreductase [Pseudoduganella albidiflava]|uniref:FAD-dependent oxidoreductase n=1 Tax=Pseudoduganella albidiflava TaxID=321983 RepID=A0A411X848_9BURK|nr:FAD-dependent oxidoreductase [Pseudoduganella albidiflava]QBI05112.1 FAD-dependent oxidoreductase [Pseudoduganella albidiflava]GGY42978.1 FAD-dependent oxidoreductase [Pseudoduganella albidiflava]